MLVLFVVSSSGQKYVVYIVAMVSIVVEHVVWYKGKTYLYVLSLSRQGKRRA